MQNRIIVYEKLNFFTFCFSLVTGYYFGKHYFIEYSAFMKKYFLFIARKRGLRQIHVVNFMNHGIQPRTAKLALLMGSSIVEANPGIAEPLIRYLKDRRAKSLAKRSAALSLHNRAYAYVMLRKFVKKNRASVVYYFPTASNFVIEKSARLRNLIVIRWHVILLECLKAAGQCVSLAILLLIPFYLFLRIAGKGGVALTNNGSRVTRKIAYFHCYSDLVSYKTTSHRNMYFFNSGILNIKDCIHASWPRPFSKRKQKYLEGKEGAVFDYQGQKMPVLTIWKRLFWNYYRSFLPYFFKLSFNKYLPFSYIQNIVTCASNAAKFENLLDYRIDIKLAVFEYELGLVPNVFTIVANKRGIKTMTMVHGYGGYCHACYGRANTIINYYLVPGKYYPKYLKRYSPDSDTFCPVGNHEMEELPSEGGPVLEDFRNKDRKVVGVLFGFYAFFPEAQSHPLFYKMDAQRVFLRFWRPFFEWARLQDNVFFIFKGKIGSHSNEEFGYEHPFMKKMLKKIPKHKYRNVDDVFMKDVIRFSDCTISTGNSSSFFTSLCMGVPSLNYNMFMTGYTAAEREGYSRDMMAYGPRELIKKLEDLLEKGLNEDVFNAVRRDHHAGGNMDSRTALRIKELINGIIASD